MAANSVPFVITVGACVVTSISPSSVYMSASTIKIKTTYLFSYYTFIQVPACGDALTYTHTVDGSSVLPSWYTVNDASRIF